MIAPVQGRRIRYQPCGNKSFSQPTTDHPQTPFVCSYHQANGSSKPLLSCNSHNKAYV